MSGDATGDVTEVEERYGPWAQAERRPDAVALVVDGVETTYRELDDRCRRVAHALAALGVEAGDRVAVMLPNSREWFETVHGIGRLGAIAVPVSIHFKAQEAGHVVADSGSKVVVAEAGLLGALADVAGVPRLVVGSDGEHAYEAALADAPDGDVEVVGDAWPTTMLYTSGTTGRPKGVAIGEGDFRRSAAGVAMMGMRWRIGPDDTYLLVGPSYHAGPAIWAQVHLAVGGRVVVMRRWDTEECLRLIDAHRVTITHMVPANFIRILELPEDVRDRFDLSSLRVVLHAAAPCPVPVKRRIMEVFPPGTVWEYYGASEGGGTSIGPDEWLRKPGSVGRPYPGNEFRILDDEGNELPPGASGRIWLRTTGSSFEYHNDPDKTARTYREGGWFSVGDVGYLDEDGYLFLTDRASDMVISGGVNIYPREIEDCLHQHPDVVDCAVFGVPDDRWGESLVAVVQRRAGSTLGQAEVVGWVRTNLADYKKPRRVDFVDELARDPNGKVVKRRLRERYLSSG
ncbi:AMP-binding protein [Rhabdothermincola sp.]|uniref:AMP-binding protein n=1 Tax=Rhabdothermincola sp. TaxID=2820405 RepID=UPI002FE25FCE